MPMRKLRFYSHGLDLNSLRWGSINRIHGSFMTERLFIVSLAKSSSACSFRAWLLSQPTAFTSLWRKSSVRMWTRTISIIQVPCKQYSTRARASYIIRAYVRALFNRLHFIQNKEPMSMCFLLTMWLKRLAYCALGLGELGSYRVGEKKEVVNLI